MLSPLVALRSSSWNSLSGCALLKVFQSHSPEMPEDESHFALQPAPRPSTAARGSSSSANMSQLAYTHFRSQYIVTKSASSTTTVCSLRSELCALVSANVDESMVAKYSERCVRMFECA